MGVIVIHNFGFVIVIIFKKKSPPMQNFDVFFFWSSLYDCAYCLLL
jgi:hypothetical protein